MAYPRKLIALSFAIVMSVALGATAHANSNDIVLYASKATVRAGTWSVKADATAAGGFLIENPSPGGHPKIPAPLAKPVSYFEIKFPAYAGQAYHLWIRGRSQNNSTNDDSVYVQFSDSVTQAGAAIDRIGTTSGAAVVLQACFGAPESGWGWTDNGWCGLGQSMYFQTTGEHTLRVQVREDGLSIDQIVLSPQTYLSTAPGGRVNDSTVLTAQVPTLSSAEVTVHNSPASGVAPLGVNFTPQVTLSSGYVRTYNWDFGDGQTSAEQRPSHTYQSAGNYTAKLTISDSTGTSASASTTTAVASGTSNGTKLRVVQANISYGGHGTDNILDLDRTTDWLKTLNPDVASLSEAIGGYNDPTIVPALMQQKTGIPWYVAYAAKYPGCAEGVMILSKWPIVSTSHYYMSYQMPISEATINVNGKLISFFATHFQWPAGDSYERQVEAHELVSFASQFPEPRIIGADLNAQVYTPEVGIILQQYNGGWDTAVSNGTATSYPDNPPSTNTRTRRSRIDHVFYSKGATNVSVTGADIPDQRAPGTAGKVVIKLGTSDDDGVRPSDHNFMEVSLDIN